MWPDGAVWAVLAFRYVPPPAVAEPALHGFLAFVVFNAAVMFGTLLAQLLGLAAFTLLAAVFVVRLERG